MMVNSRRLSLSVSLAIALVASPASAGFSIVEPPEPSPPAVGFEMGPWISVSTPTGAAGAVVLDGISGGLTWTSMQDRYVGIGLDLGYSSWLSPQAGAAFDALLGGLSGTPVSGSKTTLTALQVAGHVKVVPLPARRVTPWCQLGIGICRANSKLEFPTEQLLAAGWTVMENNISDINYQALFTSGVGLDFKIDAGMKIGVDASYQWVGLPEDSKALTALSFGGRILFGRW